LTWRTASAVLVVLLALALPIAIRHLRETVPAPPPPLRLTLEPPSGSEFGSGGHPFDLAIAPDGREVVFAATIGGHSQLWRQRLDTYRAEPLPDTEAATLPAYAADGSALWYFAGARLRRIDLATGEQRSVMDAATPGGVAVRTDGAILISTGGSIQRLDAADASAVTTFRRGDRSHLFPSWIDSGDAFVYLATLDDGRRVVRLHEGDDDVDLTRADSHGIVASGHLLFVRDGILRAEPLDVDTRRLSARGEAIAVDVGVSPHGRGSFAVGGRLLASAPPSRQAYVLRWLDETGNPTATISEPADYWQVRLSPDERSVAVTMTEPLLRTLDVFTIPASGGSPTRVTSALSADTDPVWSTDGRRLAFRSAQDGQPQIYARDVSSQGGTDEPLWRSPFDEIPSDWPAAHLVFHARSSASGFDIWALAPGASTPRAVAETGFNEIEGRISPDGRWLAYASDEGGQFDVYVRGTEQHGKRTRVSLAGGMRPQWIDGGRAVTFARGADVMRAVLGGGADRLKASPPQSLFSVPGMRDFAATRDGRRFLVIAPVESVQRRNINIVVGWAALLPPPKH
jgi:Tol biopolymer transport system component